MSKALTTEGLLEKFDLSGSTVLQFNVSLRMDDDSESPDETADEEPPPISASVFLVGKEIAVVGDSTLSDGHLWCHVVMYGTYSSESAVDFDAERDRSALEGFASLAAVRDLRPRIEALSQVAHGLVGPMRLIPGSFVGEASLYKGPTDEGRDDGGELEGRSG